MEKHPTSVEGFDGTLEELATQVVRLRYDSFESFLKALEHEVHKEAKKDYTAGRRQLGTSLYGAMRALRLAAQRINCAWRISKPHTQSETVPP